MLVTKVEQVQWHRNGIGGVGFYAVLFRTDASDMNGSKDELMVACVYEEKGCCSVLAVAPLSTSEGVQFGQNSWRGDHFEPELRAAIKAAGDTAAGRAGPFSVPKVGRSQLVGFEVPIPLAPGPMPPPARKVVEKKNKKK